MSNDTDNGKFPGFGENITNGHEISLAEDSWNELSTLGNKAQEMKLIIGHGFHKGKYEVLHPGNALLMTPKEAVVYLKQLIRDASHDG